MLCIQIPHIKSKRNAMLFGLGLALTSTLYIIYYVHKSRSVSQQEKQRCKKLIQEDQTCTTASGNITNSSVI